MDGERKTPTRQVVVARKAVHSSFQEEFYGRRITRTGTALGVLITRNGSSQELYRFGQIQWTGSNGGINGDLRLGMRSENHQSSGHATLGARPLPSRGSIIVNPNLTPCLFCSALISVQAVSCPKCGKGQQVMGRCHLCSNPVYADGGPFLPFYGPMPVFTKQKVYYFHQTCFNPLVSKLVAEMSTLRCADCGAPFSIQQDRVTAAFGPTACPNCGAPLGEFRICDICRLPIYMHIQSATQISGLAGEFTHEACTRRLGLPAARVPWFAKS